MKGYVMLLAAAAILMLVLPWPVLWGGRAGDGAGSVRSEERSEERSETPDDAVSATSAADTSTFDPFDAAGPASDDPASADVFRVMDTATGEVSTWDVRDFLIGTVACEMYATYHEEALKAQAVAAYTYYRYEQEQQRADPAASLKGADFSDVPGAFPDGYTTDGLRARWGDRFEEYYAKVSAAVDAVLGVTVTYDGAPARTVYHAISGGKTESAQTVWGTDYPYLQPADSPGDVLSPHYETVVTYSVAEIAAALDLPAPDSAEGWIGDCALSDAGTVTALEIGGESFSGTTLRVKLPLRSPCFSVKTEGEQVTFTVHGYGHNVGMSQYGADYMARQGFTWQDILNHYYTGVTVKFPE